MVQGEKGVVYKGYAEMDVSKGSGVCVPCITLHIQSFASKGAMTHLSN